MLRQAIIFFIANFSFIYASWAHEVLYVEASEPSSLGILSQVDHWMNKEIAYSLTIKHLGLCFGIILATLIFRRILVSALFNALKRWSQKTQLKWDDILIDSFEKPVMQVVFVFGLYVAIAVLPLSQDIQDLVQQGFKGLSVLLISWGLIRLCDSSVAAVEDSAKEKNSALIGFLPLIRKALRIFIIIVSVVLVIDNLGYSVAGLITTLGLGGAAFAFAAKDTIANLYGSVALALDRPFKVGDWIAVGGKVDGTVESIGLRSTRVRTFPKTLLTIPNNYLANEIINNWSRMPKRRVKQFIGVSYESSPDEMNALVEDIRTLLREDEAVDPSYMLVNFTDFGPSSLDIMVYYFTKSIVWSEYLDARQRINTKIMQAIADRGLSIAFPTQTIYFEGDVARRMAGAHGDLDSLPGDIGPSTP
ncbi:MAG: mechanosensitive ion channel family protein [Opitutales bacterium]|tara:strand:- start:325 stop:1581 length:1257 start_codon:yes stop_codon:yes gene_type:complete